MAQRFKDIKHEITNEWIGRIFFSKVGGAHDAYTFTAGQKLIRIGTYATREEAITAIHNQAA